MHVAVLIAGVADTKRPLELPASRAWRDIIATPTTPFKLSPFDEAALETALKLRDHNPDVIISVLVSDAAADVAFMRSVASFRIERVLALPPSAEQRGNPGWLAAHALKGLKLTDHPIDLILIGREHGDLDDGMTAPYLSQSWNLPFVGLAINVSRTENGMLQFNRIAGDTEEIVTLPTPACASITNDKSNRLRHPLMKNVMLAKQQEFPLIEPENAPPTSVPLDILQVEPPAATQRGEQPCRLLQGSVQEQATELANILNKWKRTGEVHVS